MMNEIDALRKDAERYRWLRSAHGNGSWQMAIIDLLHWNEDGPDGTYYSYKGDDLDREIDELMELTPNVVIEGPEQAQLANGPARMEGSA